jgi:MFS family permease
MPRLLLSVFVFTFLESVGTTLLQRGVYFYAQEILHYSETDNLWLALASGALYVVGAYVSHGACKRVGERRLLLLVLAALGTLHALVGLVHGSMVLPLGFILVGGLQGLKWPIVESYASAGSTPDRLLPLLARYNVTWALACAIAVGVSGPLIASGAPATLFLSAAVINVLALALVRGWPAHPVHLPDEHPERPDAALTARFDRLLTAARWQMLAGYALLYVLAPLMPSVFKRLSLAVSQATTAAALLDLARVGCFALLGAWPAWRGKAPPLVAVIVLMPVSFLAILFGPSLPVVLAGEAVFGACIGFAYTASLYYALVVKNASVDAGGAHEALIGLGFVFGPVAGLVGGALAKPLGADAGLFWAVLPIIVVSVAGASRAVMPRGRVG